MVLDGHEIIFEYQTEDGIKAETYSLPNLNEDVGGIIKERMRSNPSGKNLVRLRYRCKCRLDKEKYGDISYIGLRLCYSSYIFGDFRRAEVYDEFISMAHEGELSSIDNLIHFCSHYTNWETEVEFGDCIYTLSGTAESPLEVVVEYSCFDMSQLNSLMGYIEKALDSYIN